MNAKLTQLAEQRRTLVTRAAAQRAELLQALAPWREALTVVDQGVVALRFIRGYAPLLAGVAGFMIPLGPWRPLKWLQRGWMVWSIARVGKRILLG